MLAQAWFYTFQYFLRRKNYTFQYIFGIKKYTFAKIGAKKADFPLFGKKKVLKKL